MNFRFWPILIIWVSANQIGVAQIVSETEEAERQFRAETKQIDQFVRRFNGEEIESGERLTESSREFRNPKLRKDFIQILIDQTNSNILPELRNQFITDVTKKEESKFLDIHNPGWFAEVDARFLFKGVEKSLTLFLRLEQDRLGYKWVIDNIFFQDFQKTLEKDTIYQLQFLHPLSHEIDFINLNKALKGGLKPFLPENFKPEMLSIFNYEVAQGSLKFVTIRSVKFHFFQIDGWYFELSNFNRKGYNRGWLISNLVPLKNEQERKLLHDFILMK